MGQIHVQTYIFNCFLDNYPIRTICKLEIALLIVRPVPLLTQKYVNVYADAVPKTTILAVPTV